MNIRRVTLLFLAAVMMLACSRKPDPNAKGNVATDAEAEHSEAEMDEVKPPQDVIAEDCVAFLRSTKTVTVNGANPDCPQCPAATDSEEVLKFNDIRVNRVIPSGATCQVDVTMRATFNPSTRKEITGGLTAWISPEQRAAYLRGEVPSGLQVYNVKVVYRRDRQNWRAVEFDRR